MMAGSSPRVGKSLLAPVVAWLVFTAFIIFLVATAFRLVSFQRSLPPDAVRADVWVHSSHPVNLRIGDRTWNLQTGDHAILLPLGREQAYVLHVGARSETGFVGVGSESYLYIDEDQSPMFSGGYVRQTR